MARSRLIRMVTALVLAFGVASAGLTGAAVAHEESRPAATTLASAPFAHQWVGSWTASPSGTVPAESSANRSIRNIVHLGLGGTRLRVHLSNVFSDVPLYVERTTVGIPAAPSDRGIRRGTLHGVTFGGVRPVVIPAGGSVVSDPVTMTVRAGGHLSVTTYTPFGSGPVSFHRHALQVSYLAAGGAADDVSGRRFRLPTTSWYYLSGVDVFGQAPRQVVVALGDSITDGTNSSTNADRRWPDDLAARLRSDGSAGSDGSNRSGGLGVVNAGIAGNRLLADGTSIDGGPSALDRLDADALDQPGVRTVILAEGVNDLIIPPRRTAASILGAMATIVARAHARGVRVICATLGPYHGFRHWTPAAETSRDAVNARLRAGGLCDGLLDTDAVLRDPRSPRQLAGAYDSGDHLHPNDAGMAAIADAVDLDRL